MASSPRKLRTRRRYSLHFKRARVKDFESGTFTVPQMSRLYRIHPSVLYCWMKRYSSLPTPNAIIVEVPNSQTAKVKALEKRLALLERALGNKQLELDLANAKLALLAEDGIDVEKKVSSIEPSSESAKTNT